MTCWGAGGAGYCGSLPRVSAWGTGSNVINFSNGLTDLNQMVNVSNAIASANGSTTGINITGFKFSFQAKNGNGWDDSRLDQLNAYVKLYDSTNSNVLENYNYDLNRRFGWTNFAYNETFAAARAVNTVGNAQYGFIGKDNNNLIGPYGPEIINVSFSLKYRVDPCSLNPAYSSTCAGFGNIINTNNLLDSTRGGTSLNQAFAINTALASAGVGARVHGFNYGFNYRVGESWSGCTATNQDGSCSWWMDIPGRVNATVSLTNSNNQSIYSRNYSLTGDGTSGSVSDKYLLPSSMNQSLLGSGRISGSTSGTGSRIEGMWANLIYTADPCIANPLYSPDCKDYAFAMAKQLAPASSTTITYSDGSQTLDAATGMPQDPTQPLQPAGSPPPPPGSEPPPGAAPPPGAPQPAASNPGSTPANQPPPSGGSQPRAGEVRTASDNKAGPSLGGVMSMISSNQARIGNEAKSVVQAAESAAAKDAQQAQAQAETVAGALTAQSISGSMAQSGSGMGLTVAGSQSQSAMLSAASASQTSVVSIGGLRTPAPSIFVDPSASLPSSMIQSQFDMYSLQSAPGRNNTQPDPEVPQLEGIRIGGRSALNDAMEQRPMLQTATQEQRTETVNRNAQPNELASGVDIASMATQPVGYQAYSLAMPDVAFYAPREIYRNQVNVDNVRLLRGLGSDRLHQQLIDMQYK